MIFPNRFTYYRKNRQPPAFVAGFAVAVGIFVVTAVQPRLTHAAYTSAESETGSIVAATNTKKSTQNCSAYTTSEIYRPRLNTLTLSTLDKWARDIERAAPDTEILLKDGTYHLKQHAVMVKDNITIRSASGNSDAVLIRGQGYDTFSQGFVIVGDNVTIADLSMTGMRDHAIAIKPDISGGESPQIYNVELYDIGTQHIKANAGSAHGLVACSTIGYQRNGAKGDYNGAINLHGAAGWNIRDNIIYNIAGDGSGCNVDTECGRYQTGPAILVWNNSSNTVVERNTITDSTRNIAFGLGRGHDGGLIRDNYIIQSKRGDAGIELQTATGTLVENNVVLLKGNYPGAIEYRDTSKITIRHNQITAPPWDRGNNLLDQVNSNKIIRYPR